MANGRTSMSKIREILRLLELDLSFRKVAKALNISRNVVSDISKKSLYLGIKYSMIKDLQDDTLTEMLGFNNHIEAGNLDQLREFFPYVYKELKRPGVTRQILWEEYLKIDPDGYRYSQFCHYFNLWKKEKDVTMHLEHKAGDKTFVDFTGKKLQIIERETGEVKDVEVFVALLGSSQLTYVEATCSQKKEEFIKASENTFIYFNGVTKAIVPDCLKSAVTKGDKYEPDINPEYADFARHYNTAILPARPNRPRDKALVENAVGIIYTRIFAPLRNWKFYSLEELNQAIKGLLESHNNKAMQKLNKSRWKLFEESEKNYLKPLPTERYQIRKYAQATVQLNYHVYLSEDKHYYSVPYRFKGKKVQIVYTMETVEIFHKNERLALYKRNYTNNRYTTNKNHMPSHHRYIADWNPERIENWANKIGPDVKEMAIKIMQSRAHPEQGYKAALGVIHLAKKYDNQRVNAACKRAITFSNYSYKAVKNILERNLDRINEQLNTQPLLFNHENIRGEQYYE